MYRKHSKNTIKTCKKRKKTKMKTEMKTWMKTVMTGRGKTRFGHCVATQEQQGCQEEHGQGEGEEGHQCGTKQRKSALCS